MQQLDRVLGTLLPATAFIFGFSSEAQQPTQLRPWNDYRTIMWVGESAYKRPEKLPLFFQRLREMGINTAMVYGDGDSKPLLENNFPYYVENIVNKGLCLKFHSNVQDWDKFVTGWAKGGRPESALVRDYCLDDSQWRTWGRQEMQKLVRKHRDQQPLAYNIRDELSTTISANPFDYDFSPIALEQFRLWLRTQYPTLAALNKEWETAFRSWNDVRPFTTDQIKNRMASGDAQPRGQPDWQQVQQLRFEPTTAAKNPTRWNFAPWADFRTYMDLSLCGALEDFRRAAHELDPKTPVGIEGTQMPHPFGGYDLWRLAQVLDWVEPYDIGNARDILGSFMPGKPMLTTVFEKERKLASRRLWHLLLEGDRGCLVWWSEDCLDWKSDNYALTEKAKELAPVLKEMTSPLARLFLRAAREHDPIFVHYSQASIQADWLLESTVDGSTWLRRFSSFEAEHNYLAKVRNGWVKLFQDLGYSPRFIASEQVEQGKLSAESTAVLVLPGSVSLSEKESHEIGRFLTSNPAHVLLTEGAPGLFDGHCRLRQQTFLDKIVGRRTTAEAAMILRRPLSGDIGAISEGGRRFLTETNSAAHYSIDRLNAAPKLDLANWVAGELGPLRPEISLPADARARVHRFKLGRARLVAFERNINYQMSEDLKQAGGNNALEKPGETVASLASPIHVYDLRTRKYLGYLDRIQFMLAPWEPSLFALLSNKVAEEKLLPALEAEIPD
jgi:hypothetical protein